VNETPATRRAKLAQDAARIIARYPRPRSALLSLLHLVQSEEGYVSAAGIAFCAELLGLTETDVTAVVSYYTMYKRKPTGEYHVGVCTNTLCGVMGGDRILASLLDHLGTGEDQVTPDGKVSVEHVECNAACDYAPVVMVNWEFFDDMTPLRARDLVDRLRAGTGVAPSRGATRLCTWKQAARILAGFPDDQAASGHTAGHATVAGLRVAREHGWQPAGASEPAPVGEPRLLTPVLTARWDEPDSYTLEGYHRAGGYRALRKALVMSPDEVIATVKESGLRGRGGAGFPTGSKWSFIPQSDGKPHYLVVNADESEPGTCKDLPLILNNPHALIEGAIIAAYAIRAGRAFIYIRGEVLHAVRRLHHGAAEAYQSGYLGENILGTGFSLEMVVHAGAGAYECGEETALLDSLEGRRGLPRLKPPFPAVAGLYACPTVVNNVESIASVPFIIDRGADAFAALGTERSKGFGIFSLSGHVTRPGQYEAPLGVTLRELLDLAGGMRAGHRLKFWTPGGSSTPIFTSQHLDVPLDFESTGAAGSMLGTRALQIFDETSCVVRATLRWSEFYQHESCGKCTPCREGTYWLVRVLDRLEHGRGTEEDLETLLDMCDNILGRAFCPLGDAATSPVMSSIGYFRDEYLEHQKRGGCPFDPADSALAGGGRRA
jgi:NADH-quinone oxidoreductase subunit F